MIIGIGTDLVEISRVIKACENRHFLEKYFTMDEIKLIEHDKRKAADNFAVKEAVSKIFGTGFHNFSPIDIEVLREESGKPYVKLYGKALDLAKQLKIGTIHVTITNTQKYAQAFAVGESVDVR
ncbi:holo-ACP synthase [Anaeromicropila herbilytica]|uniref:Holo-[acyl-carrier-protein] synthase n=1 Tax=Anaeromicropila herbilytica TaxID=2785025 RepID=A0A7R7EN60_9FIRM|nr:holo-ACP synthase [Anaeromicropila herbilytica]BCN31935.1 holo-[acyl-carrier-protein] synthase [Anaeromicropila herbilytica]